MRVWISRQAGSAFALALVLSAALLALSSATDEGGVAWSLRLARVVPLLPLPAALAHAITLFRARARGETLALEALGIEPFQWQRWVGLAALIPAGLGAVALGLGLEASGLFPVASSAKACRVLETELGPLFECAQAGLHVRGAAIELVDPSTPAVVIGALAPWAAATVLALALALVWLAGAAVERPLRGLLALLVLLGETVVCQAVGAGVLPAAGALGLPLLVLGALLLDRARQTTMARVSITRANV